MRRDGANDWRLEETRAAVICCLIGEKSLATGPNVPVGLYLVAIL